ncbi:hypothetical protein [Nocardioides stalactiti]|uniref:hypothetical protein n=1 Tax=Nocardioides stalactiti TaxID=2755356 RepID=UPI001601E429|nr:hypothetical protein [Nocardioides stalactiti]
MSEAAPGRLRLRRRRRGEQNGHPADTSTSRWPDGEPVVPPSNLGPEFDLRVGEALSRQQPPGEDREYDLVRDHFDVAHYLLQAPAVMADPEVDPVRHFLSQGPQAKFTPEANFSTDSYLKRQPERRQSSIHPYAAWLRDGRAAGEIGEPVMGTDKLARVLGISEEEVVRLLAERRSDVHKRLHHGKLGEMFAKAVEVEPLIGDLWPEIARPRMMPIPWLVVADQLSALHASQKALGFARGRVVVVVEDPADPLAARLVAALQVEVEAHEIVVVTTSTTVPTAATPPGVRRVDFARTAASLGPLMAQQVLVELLRSLCVDAIVGVGSRLLLEALTPYGRALRASERLYLGFTALERGPLGPETGTSARYFYRHVELVDGVLTDTAATAVRLVEDHQLPDHVAAKVRSVAEDATLAEIVGRLLAPHEEPADD